MPAFSMHPSTKLGAISLTVSNLSRALSFYESTLGLKRLQHSDQRALLGIDGAAPLLELVPKQDAQAKPPRTTGLYHFAILLPGRTDLANVLRNLALNRYPLQGAADHGVSEALYLADPDGHGIEVYIDRPKHEWPWQNGRLQMGTYPLDVTSLLNQADDGWEGLSPETCVGHIHLQVTDLNQAHDFYCNVLGFEPMQQLGSSALFVSAGGYHHHIGLNTWAGMGAPHPPANAVGLRHFTIRLPNEAGFALLVEHLNAAGIAFKRTQEHEHTPNALIVHDPSGNGILIGFDG